VLDIGSTSGFNTSNKLDRRPSAMVTLLGVCVHSRSCIELPAAEAAAEAVA